MRHIALPAALLCLAAASPAPAAGQVDAVPAYPKMEAPPFPRLEPGTRVRVVVAVRRTSPITGTVLEQDARTLTVGDPSGDGGSMVLPFDAIRRMEVSVGRRTAGQGAARGATIGFANGFVAGFVLRMISPDYPDRWSGDREEWLVHRLHFGVRAGGAAAIVGAALGTQSREVFEDRTPRPVFGIAPAPEGGAAVSLTFRTR